jgi:CubicO group peptidase (beta-lactamase class C family)
VSNRWNRPETWIALIVAGLGLLVAAVLGLFAYMSATATPLHPDPESVPSVADPAPPAEWAAVVEEGRRILRAGLIEQNLPGLSVAVGAGGDIVWAEGFGWADLENRVRAAPGLRFRIGTASKMLTSAAVGVLLEKGRIKLEDDIRAYVPRFPEKERPVTLRHLMAHQAGVATDGGDEGPLYSERCDRPVDALPHFADRALLFEPGTRYRYSSYGWILVSAAVEAAADEPFLGFMQEEVFEPLRLGDTREDSATEPVPDRVVPYFPRFSADPRYGLHGMRSVDYSCYAGASAFISTPSDMVRFVMAINGGKLLQPATVGLLQTSQRLTSGEETGYGLGWDVEDVPLAGAQIRTVGHDGEILGGPVASIWSYGDSGIVVAVMSNISYADTASLATRIAQAFIQRSGSPERR